MNLNYVHAIQYLRPGAQVALVGGVDYGNIQWGVETPIPQTELDAALLAAQTAHDLRVQRGALKAARSTAVAAITVATSTGKVFDGDEVSQTRMARAIIGLQAAGVPTITWTLADNSVVAVTLTELTEALILAGQQQAAVWPIPEQS